MFIVILRWVSFLGLVASAVWFGTSFCSRGESIDWGSITTFISALSAFLLTEVNEHKKLARRDADRKLFSKLQTLIPSSGAIRYFKETGMANAIHNEQFEPLDTFVREWSDPEHEFLQRKLQKKLRLLLKHTESFLVSVNELTVSDDRERQSVPKEWRDDIEMGKKHRTAVSELNKKADLMVHSHEDLFRAACRILSM